MAKEVSSAVTVAGLLLSTVIVTAGACLWISKRLDRIEKKENANAAKIGILAMDLPAGKKRDLLETVDKMEAILPANSQMAVKMVLEDGTSNMATLPKAGTMDFNNLEQK